VPLEVGEAARHVALVTIDNRPKRNAMSRSMMAELAELRERCAPDDCSCILITGADDRAFCAGADIGGDLSVAEESARDRALLKIRVYSKPIVRFHARLPQVAGRSRNHCHGGDRAQRYNCADHLEAVRRDRDDRSQRCRYRRHGIWNCRVAGSSVSERAPAHCSASGLSAFPIGGGERGPDVRTAG
jgi:hypothetical protein